MINHASVDFRNDRLKEIQSILSNLAPHEHEDGMNECAICDQGLDEAILIELRKLPAKPAAEGKTEEEETLDAIMAEIVQGHFGIKIRYEFTRSIIETALRKSAPSGTDTERLDKLEHAIWNHPETGNGIAIFPTTGTIDRIRKVSLHGLGDEDGSNLGDEITDSCSDLRAAIDQLPSSAMKSAPSEEPGEKKDLGEI